MEKSFLVQKRKINFLPMAFCLLALVFFETQVFPGSPSELSKVNENSGDNRRKQPLSSNVEAMDAAQNFFSLGKLDEAEKSLQSIIGNAKEDPSLKEAARCLLVRVFKERKDFERALEEIEKILGRKGVSKKAFLFANLEKVSILARDLPTMNDLLDAYSEFFQNNLIGDPTVILSNHPNFFPDFRSDRLGKCLACLQELAALPDREWSDPAKVRLALASAFLEKNSPKALELLNSVSPYSTAGTTILEALFLKGVLFQYFLPKDMAKNAAKAYVEFRSKTTDLKAYRIVTALLGILMLEEMKKPDEAANLFGELGNEPPARFSSGIASDSPVLKKQWHFLGSKLAGFVCDSRLNDPARAASFFQKAVEIKNELTGVPSDPWLNNIAPKYFPQGAQASTTVSSSSSFDFREWLAEMVGFQDTKPLSQPGGKKDSNIVPRLNLKETLKNAPEGPFDPRNLLHQSWTFFLILFSPAIFALFLLLQLLAPVMKGTTFWKIFFALLLLFGFLYYSAYFYFFEQVPPSELAGRWFHFLRGNLATLGLFAAVLFVASVVFWRKLIPFFIGDIPFDSERWQKGSVYDRQRMLKSLLKKYDLMEMTRPEILKMLGKPDLEPEKSIVYFLPNFAKLVVVFYPSGRVKQHFLE